MKPARRVAAAVLVTSVMAVHLWLAGQVLEARLGEGAADTRPRRMAVSFVRELAQAAPPLAMPKPLQRAARRPANPAAAAAVAAPAPEPVAAPVASAAAPASSADAAVEVAAAAVPVAPAASAASAPAAFDWPPSTRLSYTLTGNYRGPVEGQAQVEWLRSGSRYQVHLEVAIGPRFAPLVSRRLSSEGEITAQGLQPRRYDEETKVILREARRQSIGFEGDQVLLPGGRSVPRPAAVQDTASQFVQLTWLFTTQPALLQAGRSIDIALALPRYVDTWTYDVLAATTLHTMVGPVDTVHVKPRRTPRPGVELTAEMWVAPSLQYLPVRIVIRQDDDTFVDLLIDQLPRQEATPGR